MGDKVGMGVCSRMTTICPIQHPQAKPAYISLYVVYNYASVGGATEAYGSLFVCVRVCVCPESNLENR